MKKKTASYKSIRENKTTKSIDKGYLINRLTFPSGLLSVGKHLDWIMLALFNFVSPKIG